ncbi:MAG: LacI family DNA-binding transcriptional regulator [Phycisphaerales bacterium JB059]
MSSVRKIANSVGVSVATVSRALNNHPDVSAETRQRVLEAARSTGYIPSVGKKPTNVIGLVYPTGPVQAGYGDFDSLMLSGIVRGANEQRYDVTIINLDRDKDRYESYTQFFHRKGVRGVIIRALEATSQLASEIAAESFPSIMVADRSDDPNVNFVDSESRSTSREAVDHLVDIGHTRIALAIHNVMDSDHQDREDGYCLALESAGIERDPELTVRAPAGPEGGAMMLDHLLQLEDPPTAIFFTNPLSTVGALHRCLQLGIRVPKDLSIIGFDDGDVRMRTYPNFTAVCQDAQGLGYEAAVWLTRLLSGNAHHSCRELHRTTLNIHGSTSLSPPVAVRLTEGNQVVRQA